MTIYDLFMTPLENRILSRIRSNIISKAYGSVLEIGYGTGANFRYYNPALISQLYALELCTNDIAKSKASFSVEFSEGRAEMLPFEAAFFDSVVETLVLCSVENLSESIGEVFRVLKPGGFFIFIDHVLPERKGLASLFKATNIFWPRIAGGCSLTREPHKAIEAAGFSIEESGSSGFDVFRWGIAKKG